MRCSDLKLVCGFARAPYFTVPHTFCFDDESAQSYIKQSSEIMHCAHRCTLRSALDITDIPHTVSRSYSEIHLRQASFLTPSKKRLTKCSLKCCGTAILALHLLQSFRTGSTKTGTIVPLRQRSIDYYLALRLRAIVLLE